MDGVSSFSVRDYKSGLWALCAAFFRSRESLRARLKEVRRQKDFLNEDLRSLGRELRALTRKLQQTEEELTRFRRQRAKQQASPCRLPEDPNLKGHQFGPQMIALCCAMANLIGFRSTVRVLPLIQKWLGVEFAIPGRDAIRLWSSRNGVAILQESRQRASDWIWLIDHSVQLGKMCVLVVLGIRQSELPAGRSLQRHDMKPLAVVPASSRTKEDVGKALTELSVVTGTPICIVCDGATELHEGAKWLENEDSEPVLMGDMKHIAANLLKRILGENKRFKAFDSQLGRTTACIQQTELAHLLPPTKKTKCRFMNLNKLMKWVEMVEFHLATPEAPGNQHVSAARLTQKLGWLLEYEHDLKQWQECREIISVVLDFTNCEGVYVGATEALIKNLEKLSISSAMARQVLGKLVDAFSKNEAKLAESKHSKLRVPCSTEVLESSLGRFKALQRHHNRGTFTSLLAIYPTLFESTSADHMAQRLKRVSTKDLKEWLKQAGLSSSTHSRKTAACLATKMARLEKTA